MDGRDEFLKLLLAHEHDLRAFIGSLVVDRHARDDIFQNVALVLWEQFEEFDRSRSFGAWARGIAAKKVLQERDRGRRFPLAFSPETVEAILDAFQRTEAAEDGRAEALAKCVEQLPEPSRELLRLRYGEGKKASEMIGETWRTLEAVWQALSRLRARLEECVRRRLALEAGGAA